MKCGLSVAHTAVQLKQNKGQSNKATYQCIIIIIIPDWINIVLFKAPKALYIDSIIHSHHDMDNTCLA